MKECSFQKLDKVEHNANVKFWQTAHVPLHYVIPSLLEMWFDKMFLSTSNSWIYHQAH